MSCFAELNEFSCVLDHANTASCLVKSLRGRMVSERFRQTLLRYWHMPRKRWTAALSVGLGISFMAVTLDGSGSTPLSVSLCPMKVTELALNWSFFAESCRSWSLLLSNRTIKFQSWFIFPSSLVSQHTNMQTSSLPSRNSCWWRWYSSGPWGEQHALVAIYDGCLVPGKWLDMETCYLIQRHKTLLTHLQWRIP